MNEDIIRQSGPTVVVRAYQGGGDVRNAFVVLAQVVGIETAKMQVTHEAERLGENPVLVMAAVYR